MGDNLRISNTERLKAAGIPIENLRWFLQMASASDLDSLPTDGLYFPGQSTPSFRETLINLADGRPVYLPEVVPAGTTYCLLNPLKVFMRTEAKRPA